MGFIYTDGHTHITPGVWYHVAMTYDASSGTLKLYVNGTNDVTVSSSGNIIRTSAPLYIGGSPNPNYPYYFPGLIDEVDIFDRALSASEIQAIYNAGSAGKCSGCCSGNCVTVSGIAGWWPGDNSPDDFPLRHPFTPYGNLSYSSGEVERGFYLNGLGAYGKVASTPDLDVGLNDGMTIEAWVRPDDGTARPILAWCSTTTSGVHLWANYPVATDLIANFVDTGGNTHNLTASRKLSLNTFNHVVATYSKSTGLLKLYVNGAIQAQYNWGTFTPRTGTGFDLYLGYWPFGGANFYGVIDEPTVYSRELQDTEISAIWAAGLAGKCQTTQSPPVISTQPQSQITALAANVTLSVTATGTAPLSVPAVQSTWILATQATNSRLRRPSSRPFRQLPLLYIVGSRLASPTELSP